MIVEVKKTSWYVRRGPCEGVKTCVGSDRECVVSNRQKINRCIRHREIYSLLLSGPCIAHMVYNGLAMTMESDGLVFYLELDTITKNQLHTACQAKSCDRGHPKSSFRGQLQKKTLKT